ncbi:MAG: hypothetical protein ACHQYQ_10130 [Bacteriovoracales bacterium]
MRKSAISKKQKKSERKSLRTYGPFKSQDLKDKKIVVETLLDCIKTGDLDTFREVLVAHLMTVNKMELANRAGIGRRTLYDLIDSKKKFNPGLSTISAVIRALAA